MARVIFCNGGVRNVTPDNGTDFSYVELRGFVGGYIEVISLTDDKIMVVDEEGKLKRKLVNMEATRIAWESGLSMSDYIVGDAIICHKSEVK